MIPDLTLARQLVNDRMALARVDASVLITRGGPTASTYNPTTMRLTAGTGATVYQGPAHIHDSSAHLTDVGSGEVSVRQLPISLPADLPLAQRPAADDQVTILTCAQSPSLVGAVLEVDDVAEAGLIGGVIRVITSGTARSRLQP